MPKSDCPPAFPCSAAFRYHLSASPKSLGTPCPYWYSIPRPLSARLLTRETLTRKAAWECCTSTGRVVPKTSERHSSGIERRLSDETGEGRSHWRLCYE